METQQSISQWASETFGPVGSNLRVATRAGEEMFELFREIASGINELKAIEEAADVAIVLYRVCTRLGIAVDTSKISRSDRPNPLVLAAEANSKLTSVIVMLCHDDNSKSAGYSLQQMYYLLEKFCEVLGANLYDAIDSKMLINRRRKWRKDPDSEQSGVSYHVKE